MKYAKSANSIEYDGISYIVKTNANEIRITFHKEDVLHIESSFNECFEHPSLALVETTRTDYFDKELKDERKRIVPASSSLTKTAKSYILKSEKLMVKIEKEPFRLLIKDKKGQILHSDIVDLGYVLDNNNRQCHSDEISNEDCFYGLGEKSGEINHLHHFFTMNAGDTYGYDPIHSDGLYKHIPFFIKLNRLTHKACGYFYNTASECDFDFGRRYSNYWKRRMTYRNNNGELDYFFIAGPEISEIVRKFTDLTGKSAFLPKYSLGYLGSSMIYAELPAACDKAILNFVRRAKKEEIPLDGFQLSSGYTMYHMKRCVFTWNRLRFPNPKKFIRDMEKEGIVTSPNVKPGILKVHPYYSDMEKQNMFIRDEDGQIDVGKWWGGEGSFVDFTDENARASWKKYLKENLLDYGIRSIWNDNCEYEGVFNDDAVCKAGKISNLRSIMANLMCKLTIEAIKESYPNERPFVVCRAGGSGIQRYAQTWSGDNYTSWDSLKYNIATMLNAGLSGLSNYGSDVGGFAGPSPEAELLVRWVQCGIFEQRFSIHSVNDDLSITEPWMYKEHTQRIRDAIQLRYRLTPYYYSLMYKNSLTGSTFMKPLFEVFQEDENTYDDGTDFIVGDYLLVSPVVEKNQKVKEIYLPKDTTFYNFFTHEKVQGGQTICMDVDMDTIPLYLREGAIVPMSYNQLMNLQKDHIDTLHYLIVPGKEKSSFTLFEDDGLSYNYLSDNNHQELINVSGHKNIKIENHITGQYRPSWKSVLFEVICDEPSKVFFHSKELTLVNEKEELKEGNWYYDSQKQSLYILLGQPESDYSISIQ